eukprot:jgi/Ulvmu1/1000/UM103_0028.1
MTTVPCLRDTPHRQNTCGLLQPVAGSAAPPATAEHARHAAAPAAGRRSHDPIPQHLHAHNPAHDPPIHGPAGADMHDEWLEPSLQQSEHSTLRQRRPAAGTAAAAAVGGPYNDTNEGGEAWPQGPPDQDQPELANLEEVMQGWVDDETDML